VATQPTLSFRLQQRLTIVISVVHPKITLTKAIGTPRCMNIRQMLTCHLGIFQSGCQPWSIRRPYLLGQRTCTPHHNIRITPSSSIRHLLNSLAPLTRICLFLGRTDTAEDSMASRRWESRMCVCLPRRRRRRSLTQDTRGQRKAKYPLVLYATSSFLGTPPW
jgi:hypothetical protein